MRRQIVERGIAHYLWDLFDAFEMEELVQMLGGVPPIDFINKPGDGWTLESALEYLHRTYEIRRPEFPEYARGIK